MEVSRTCPGTLGSSRRSVGGLEDVLGTTSPISICVTRHYWFPRYPSALVLLLALIITPPPTHDSPLGKESWL